jgi:hypothetical protein
MAARWLNHGHSERTAVRGRMGYRLVGVVEREELDIEMSKIEQARTDQTRHERHGLPRIHPFAAYRDVVAHDPRIGQVEPRAAQHAHATHQNDAAVRAHGHDRGAHGRHRCRRRQQIDHAIYRTRRRPLHPRAIRLFIA